jgi:hypothetical protein
MIDNLREYHKSEKQASEERTDALQAELFAVTRGMRELSTRILHGAKKYNKMRLDRLQDLVDSHIRARSESVEVFGVMKYYLGLPDHEIALTPESIIEQICQRTTQCYRLFEHLNTIGLSCLHKSDSDSIVSFDMVHAPFINFDASTCCLSLSPGIAEFIGTDCSVDLSALLSYQKK